MKVTLKAHSIAWRGIERLRFAPINFTVKQGEIFGLLGDAASRNMDFLRILAGTSHPKSGSLNVLGTSNIASVRHQIGSTFDVLGFIDEYSIEKNIKMLCMYKEVRPKEAAKMLHLFDLWTCKDKVFGKCTQEQKKRVEIVCALIGNPQIILLDKPLRFLKRGTALIVCKLLLKAAANNQTVFITDKPGAEIAKICTQILELEKPRIKTHTRNIRKTYLINKKAS